MAVGALLHTYASTMGRSRIASTLDALHDVAYGKAVKRLFPEGYTIDALWDGNKTNKNAWLTILRHESNTWVMTGRQGGIPRSQ